jgi:acetyl esterase/lipase
VVKNQLFFLHAHYAKYIALHNSWGSSPEISMPITTTEQQLSLDGAPLCALVLRNSAAPVGAPLVLHLHGGAFVSGCMRTGTGVATLLSEAGATVIMTAYPLAPQNPFPAAIDHIFKVLKRVDSMRGELASKKSPLVVAGEESGGNLAAAVTMMARDQRGPELSGQILIAPMLDPCIGTGSMRAAEAGPVGCCFADGWRKYLGSGNKAEHPYASPANASRLSGLAPALIVTATDDPLHDESLAYAERLRGAGVKTIAAELAAPTHWPAALQAETVSHAPWADALREQFAGFFETIAVGPRHVAAHGIKA